MIIKKGKGVGWMGRLGLTRIYYCVSNRKLIRIYSTAQGTLLCGDLNKKEIQKRGDICIPIANSLCCTAEINRTLESKYTLITFFLKKY